MIRLKGPILLLSMLMVSILGAGEALRVEKKMQERSSG
jgi:hypothetical protein